MTILNWAWSNRYYTIHEEEGGGIRLTRDNLAGDDEKGIPIEAIIASINLNASTNRAEYGVFNQKLWDDNFSVPPPSLGLVRARTESATRFQAGSLFFNTFIIQLFFGEDRGYEIVS